MQTDETKGHVEAPGVKTNTDRTVVDMRGTNLFPNTVSVVIPTFNGSNRIGNCLEALIPQASQAGAEILVVDDGSTDNTSVVVARYPTVRLVMQPNAGPASARNRGALEATGTIVLFTDDDCVPTADWIRNMVLPFMDPDLVGAKGAYRTLQKQIVARFAQLEYEDKYRYMSLRRDIDFIDTYSGAYRRDRFLEMQGYDTTFPVACAEDIELSYRMSVLGWKMRFVPNAVVSHTHPADFVSYMKKKYKFAYWRMVAVRKNPRKGLKDSHTPQLMKLQVLLLPSLLAAASVDLTFHLHFALLLCTASVFVLSTCSFVVRSFRKDPLVAFISPALLAARACAQLMGVAAGVVHAHRNSTERTTNVPRESPKQSGQSALKRVS